MRMRMSVVTGQFNRMLILAVCFAAMVGCLSSVIMAQTQDAPLDMVTDVIVGRNNKGPYTLSWTNIDQAGVSVVVNGRTLKNRHDFNIDTSKGVISFNSIVLKDAIVRVSYRIVPGKSQKTAGQAAIPVTLNLLDSQNSSVKVTGLYAQDDPRSPDAAKTIIGLGADRKWKRGNVESLFLFSQKNDDNDESSTWDRAAFKFGTNADIAGINITGNFLHSGSNFLGTKEYGLAAGKEAVNLTASYTASARLRFAAQYVDTEDTAGNTSGNKATIQEQSMVYNATDATKLSLTHTHTETASAAAGSAKTVDSNAVRLDQAIGTKTTAVVGFEDARIEQGGATDNVRSSQVSVATSATPKTTVHATLTQKDSELMGKEQGASVGVTTKPIDQLNVDVTYNAVDNEITGHKANTVVKVTAAAAENTSIQANLASNILNDTEQYQRDIVVTSSPARFAKFSASFSQKGVDENDDVAKGAGLELIPFTHTSLAAKVNYIENGMQVLTVKDYKAATSVWRFLSLSGSFRDRELQQAAAVDTTDVQVALNPYGFLSLTGGYQANPEDTRGAVQQYYGKTVGLNMSIGSFAVRTNYTTKDEYTANRFSDERKIGLDMPFFGAGRLTTGFIESRMTTGSELATRTYSLGYKHAIGSDFNLSLTGYYTQYLQDRMAMPEQSEYKAEANLGVRF